jgi:hypothetical protein
VYYFKYYCSIYLHSYSFTLEIPIDICSNYLHSYSFTLDCSNYLHSYSFTLQIPIDICSNYLHSYSFTLEIPIDISKTRKSSKYSYIIIKSVNFKE